MSHDLTKTEPRLGYLLLRDSHAIPLRGISPEELKIGAKRRVLHPDKDPLKHQRTLKAIVNCLGFHGDFGTFLSEGWPEFQRFLKRHGCTHRAGLFPVDHGGCIDLYFGEHFGPRPRQLADRIFEAKAPVPQRVFLGYGVDWAAWDHGNGIHVPVAAIVSITGNASTARQRADNLFIQRHDLAGQWGFLDDKLVDGPVRHVIDKTYWPAGADPVERKAHHAKTTAAVAAFRATVDDQHKGWVDILRYNERLVVLRGHNGGWDVLWRNYREKEPPQPSLIGHSNHLAVEDMPSRLMTESDLQRSIHFRQDVWEELEEHESEQAFYDRGGNMQARQLSSTVDVRLAWLREQGKLPAPELVQWNGVLPPGFRAVVIDGRKVAMSDLIDVGSFRRMLIETGYADRCADNGEPWERANEGASDDMPIGASWVNAQAYCAWRELQLGVALRLPTREELRALRPAYAPHYESMANRDFPWEVYPPRPLVSLGGQMDGSEVPSAIVWSEPRFLEPGPDVPEYPEPSGRASHSRQRWIKDFPPRAVWKSPLPLTQYGELTFIDAWDAYEWCQESGWINGRFWEGKIGVDSWGAYKNSKVSFRVVLDLEV